MNTDTIINYHLDDGLLLSLIDNELGSGETAAAEAHLRECSDCTARRERMVFATRRVSAALEALDPAPTTLAAREMLAGRSRRSAPAPERFSGGILGGIGTPARWWAAAAGLTFVIAAGAYAVPATGVRDLFGGGLDALVRGLAGGDGGASTVASAAPQAVAAMPRDGVVHIQLDAPGDPALSVRVVLDDGPWARVEGQAARFTVEEGRIEAAGASGDILVQVPRSAESAVLIVNGVEAAVSQRGFLALTPAAERSGATIELPGGN
ncbi:MAG: zf-HC2 domain-containing protein [Gemmatimonadetes bacterium]|nr:zf-HC2 domain-containing protein [Gemmatimonadota bacterium]